MARQGHRLVEHCGAGIGVLHGCEDRSQLFHGPVLWLTGTAVDRVRHGAQPLDIDLGAAFRAQTIHALVDALERRLDVFEFAGRGAFDGLEHFVVLHREGGIGRVPRQRLALASEIAANTLQAVAQLGGPGQEAGAHAANPVIDDGAHGSKVEEDGGSRHSPLYVFCPWYCVHRASTRNSILRPMFSRETQALMEAAVDAVVVIDHRGRMLAVNDASDRIFGYRTDELLGENVSMLMDEPDRSAHDGYLARHLETGVGKTIGIGREVRARHKNGSVFPLHLSVGRIRESMPPHFVGLFHAATPAQATLEALQMERDRALAFLELHDSILLEI